jgi:hypothetical protein
MHIVRLIGQANHAGSPPCEINKLNALIFRIYFIAIPCARGGDYFGPSIASQAPQGPAVQPARMQATHSKGPPIKPFGEATK